MLLLWVLRFFVFHLYESPKYLMGRGRDEEAVEVVRKVAAYNGKETKLTVEMLKGVGRKAASEKGDNESIAKDPENGEADFDTSAKGAIIRKLRKFDLGHVKPLFATRKLAYSTSLLIILWGTHFVLPYSGTYLLIQYCSSHWSGIPTVGLFDPHC